MKTKIGTILVLILSQKKLPGNARTRVPVAVILLRSPTTVNTERCEPFAQGRALTVVSIGLHYQRNYVSCCTCAVETNLHASRRGMFAFPPLQKLGKYRNKQLL